MPDHTLKPIPYLVVLNYLVVDIFFCVDLFMCSLRTEAEWSKKLGDTQQRYWRSAKVMILGSRRDSPNAVTDCL